MILNGKEIRVILGAIIVFTDIPLSCLKKRKISESEDKDLENFYNKLDNIEEKEYEKCFEPNDSRNIVISKRLAISIELTFPKQEFILVKEALEYYIAASEAANEKHSLNVYHNGEEYGLVIQDFKDMLNRLQSEF